MHSIVTTFREAVIKVEVANFGAANRHLDRSRCIALCNMTTSHYCASMINKRWDLLILHYLLGKGGYVFGSVGLFVCLSVCGQHYSKRYERIGMKFYGLGAG